jgi:hypothetical protein
MIPKVKIGPPVGRKPVVKKNESNRVTRAPVPKRKNTTSQVVAKKAKQNKTPMLVEKEMDKIDSQAEKKLNDLDAQNKENILIVETEIQDLPNECR